MWDPRQYTDTDYGLADDEEFEPDDDDRDVDFTRMAHVATVLGPVAPMDLGVSFVAEHLLYEIDNVPAHERLDSVPVAIEELTAFVTSGARTIVDIATLDTGRDILGLMDIARRVPAHIVAATGGDAATITREATEGIGPRRIRPGVVVIDPNRDGWLETARAATSSRIPRLLLSRPDQHSAHTLDHFAMIDDGSDVEADGFIVVSLAGEPDRLPDAVGRIVALLQEGCGDRLMLAMGWDRRPRWHAYDGQPGLVFGMERIPLALMNAGVAAKDIRRMLIENPSRWLTIDPESPPVRS